MVSAPRVVIQAAVVMLAACPAFAAADGAVDALLARAAVEAYNLDRDQAVATYREAIALDPDNADAHRGLASVLWLSVTIRRGSMTVDDYLGGVTRQVIALPPPPPELAADFHGALDRALAIARRRAEAAPRDPEAHYQVGAALGLRASYIATVDGRMAGALRAAREAYNEHEKVLTLDPRRKDAGLIVGTYRYVVSVLALPLRWAAYVVGFGGGKERGIRMIEEAVAYGGPNQDDGRFALVLMYNRESRYDEALRHLQILRQRFPRNRLLWVETAATSLRAGRAADADRFITDAMTRFAGDDRPRMFGEGALMYYKRGAARAALGRTADAEQDLRRALALDGRNWVRGRSHLELGRLAQKAGNRAAARTALETAISLCSRDNDAAAADQARRLLRQLE